MAKSAKKRQAEYRAKRKAQGLCAYPGCDRKPRKYALCPGHREDAREQGRDRTVMASMYDELLTERDIWWARARAAESDGVPYRWLSDENKLLHLKVSELELTLTAAQQQPSMSYRDLYQENTRLKIKVSELEFDLAVAQQRKAGYLPEGIPESTRLKPGQPVRVGIVA